MRNKLFRRADILLVFACLLLAAVFFLQSFLSPSDGMAVIEQNGIEVGRYALSQIQKEEILQLPGEIDVQILLEPGAASFLSSDCICFGYGSLNIIKHELDLLLYRFQTSFSFFIRKTNGF